VAFRVGVLGHRPNRLQGANLDQLAETLKTILVAVQEEMQAFKSSENSWLYDDGTPKLRAISPLAEGTDRIFAEQALGLGFELACVTPFPVPEFEKDFAPGAALESNSLVRFRSLLEKATTVFQLDGNRSDDAAAYGAGGRVVLNHSDILVVVWDGERQNKRGGTEEKFDEARRQGIPVVWVDATAPHRWQLLSAKTPLPVAPAGARVTPDGSGSAAGLKKWVRDVLELPRLAGAEFEPAESDGASSSNQTESEASQRSDYRQHAVERFYAERRPRWTLAILWRIVQSVMGDAKWPKVRVSIDDFEKAVESEWPRDRSTPMAAVIDDLRPYYAWTDKLAVLYADRYRSAYLLVFMLAALAVGLALLPVGSRFISAHHTAALVCNILELLAIMEILAIIHVGRRQHWHERFLDYRLAAELVRHLRIVAPLGGRWPIPQVPAHWATHGEPAATWMVWYVRAVERAVGFPSAVVDASYLNEYLKELGTAVDGQVGFHKNTERRGRNIEGRLHHLADWLFGLTIAACAIHLGIHFMIEDPEAGWVRPLALVFVCGFFPALGAALAGIMNQAEFRRIGSRSRAMSERLAVLHNDIERLRIPPPGPPVPVPLPVSTSVSASGMRQLSVQAVALANAVADLLVAEVLDWRVILRDRPLEP
jgi:hypothetical protein